MVSKNGKRYRIYGVRVLDYLYSMVIQFGKSIMNKKELLSAELLIVNI